MLLYRITLEKWSKTLTASGQPARWNSKGKYVIYTAGSRALACLENVVHRSGEGLSQLFKVMVIEVPDEIHVESVSLENLPENWHEFSSYSFCQQIGDDWIERVSSAILSVPSSIIRQEHNFLINPHHPDFKHIKILRTEDFLFDPRIKE